MMRSAAAADGRSDRGMPSMQHTTNAATAAVHPKSPASVGLLGAVAGIVLLTVNYWRGLYSFVILRKSYAADSSVFGDDVWAKAQVYSISLIFKLWSKPHYRSASFQQDMLDNLKNVAIPGTGIPLSYFCGSYLVCLLFVFVGNPAVCLLGAVHKAAKEQEEAEDFSLQAFARAALRYYGTHLLHPDDWFSLWRLNCRLATYHSQVASFNHLSLSSPLSLTSLPGSLAHHSPSPLSLASLHVPLTGHQGPGVPPRGQVDVPHRGQGNDPHPHQSTMVAGRSHVRHKALAVPVSLFPNPYLTLPPTPSHPAPLPTSP